MTEGRLTVVATEGKEILDSFIGFAIQNKRLGEARPRKIHSNRNNAIKLESSAGAKEIALLRCNSAYPAPPTEFDLRTITHMAATWSVPVGLSDHTRGTTGADAATALGYGV